MELFMAVGSPVPARAPSLTTHPTLHAPTLRPVSPLLNASATVPALYHSTQHRRIRAANISSCPELLVNCSLYRTIGLLHKDKLR